MGLAAKQATSAVNAINGIGPERKTLCIEGSVSRVVQSDDGRYRLGLHDDASPGFETRTFAAAVLALERPPPCPEMRSPPAATEGPNRKTEEQPEENTTSAMRSQEVSPSWGAA